MPCSNLTPRVPFVTLSLHFDASPVQILEWLSEGTAMKKKICGFLYFVCGGIMPFIAPDGPY